MTRRTIFGVLAAPLLPAPAMSKEIERIRYYPQAGDVITGPNGRVRVEVHEVFRLYTGSEMVWYFKGNTGYIVWLREWQDMRDWDKARIA